MLKQKYNIKQIILAAFALSVLVSFSFNGQAFSEKAAKSTSLSPESALSPYNAGTSIDPGMIVGLKSSGSNTVVPLEVQNISQMLGVAVNPNQAAEVLSPSSINSKQVYVATSGQYDVLVSNQDGAIKVGTPISISSLAGIGMAASTDQNEIIGKALAAFNGKSGIYGTAKLSDSFSQTTLSIGLIPVSVGVAHNPLLSGSTNYVPSVIGNAAVAISDKPVSPIRIYISLVVILASLFIAGVLLYGGIRSGIMAIGRNPLSKKSIIRSLIQTTITGLVVFAAGLSGVYLILKL